jgi:hypothetical protein
LFVDPLDVPEALLLVLVIRSHDDGDNVEFEPETRAQIRAHVLERRGETGSNELGKVVVLIVRKGLDDIVCNEILAHSEGIVEHNMLDGEVNEVNRVVDGEGDDCSVIIGEDCRDTDVDSLWHHWSAPQHHLTRSIRRSERFGMKPSLKYWMGGAPQASRGSTAARQASQRDEDVDAADGT